MHHIISNINKIVPLQQYIDSNIKVGLRSITYNVGWYNINHEYVRWTVGGGTQPVEFIIQPGLYGFDELISILLNTGLHLVSNVNRSNGIVIMTVPAGYKVKIYIGLKLMLGITDTSQWLSKGTHIGGRSINFIPLKSLYIHLSQVNTTNTFYDGAPSDLIGIVPVKDKSFGHAVNVQYQHPEFRLLAGGTISELAIRVTDQNNNTIDNHGLQISIVLEFI